MIVLGYIGNHKKDSILSRIGWAMTRLVQRGFFQNVTHVEAFYGFGDGGLAQIGSASLLDGGVRTKSVRLNEEHWIAIDVPDWDAGASLKFIQAHLWEGYDTRGALATVFLGGQDEDRWFCNEIVAASVGVVSPDIFGPAQFMSLALSMPGANIVPVPCIKP